MSDTSDPVVLFESNTEEPTEFVYEGETMINFGSVRIIKMPEGDLGDVPNP